MFKPRRDVILRTLEELGKRHPGDAFFDALVTAVGSARSKKCFAAAHFRSWRIALMFAGETLEALEIRCAGPEFSEVMDALKARGITPKQKSVGDFTLLTLPL